MAPPPVDIPLPRLSVIIPARNEEAALPMTVKSLLEQDYPELELVLVDDRSTDRTLQIIAQVADNYPDRVRAISVRDLPTGWLGKNHALWLGAQEASGDWLLFTDADVLFHPECCRTAVAHAQAQQLDHLTLMPRITARGYWLNAYMCLGYPAFVAQQRSYLVNDPDSQVGLGFGAFNLLRRGAYRALGTHAALSLRPDDDLRLGLRVKRLGLHQQVLSGVGLLEVEWYPSVMHAIVGTEKNIYAILDYGLTRAVSSVGLLSLLLVYPYLALWRTRGVTRQLLIAAIGLSAANVAYANHGEGRSAIRTLPILPVTSLLFLYAVCRAIWSVLACGGIRWRDTFYPLGLLKSQTGLECSPKVIGIR